MTSQGKGRKITTWASRALLAFGIVALIAGAMPILRDWMSSRRYAGLAETSLELAIDAGEGPKIHWETLREINPAVVAWVSVDGTAVDSPVVVQDPDDPGFWLTHDFFGDYSMLGCPFLDDRCDPDYGAQLVFGHHFTGTDWVFSDLQHAHEQDVFDGLGAMWWSTPDGGNIRLVPLCAMRVDEGFEPIQRFDMYTSEMRTWLSELCGQASARAEGWEGLAADAEDAVTLVTCSEDAPRRPWRTLVTFVRAEEAGDAAA